MDIETDAADSSTPLGCPVEGCTKTFTRADHVRRHVSSSHQRALPYLCTTCHKRFGRRDLLKRHALKHEEHSADGSERGKEHKPRVRQACSTCAFKKLKCDGEWPCGRCSLKSIQCSYPPRDGPPDGPEKVQKHPNEHSVHDQSSPRTIQAGSRSGNSTESHPTPVHRPYQMFQQAPDLTHSMGTPDSGFQSLPGQGLDTSTFGDVLDFGNQYSLDFNEIDFSIFDTLDSEYQPMQQQTTSTSTLSADQPHSTASMFLIGGFEAFQRSLWYWNPAQRQMRAIDERENLKHPISTAGAGTDQKLGNESIDQTTRDRFLFVVAESFKLANSTTSTQTSFFPSEKILNDLLQFSLAEQYIAIDSWIHSHFFQSTEARIPLLASLVAQGAVHSALPVVQKFGYTFQEAVRMKGPTVFEEDSRLTRDLGIWQAFMTLLQIGLWSGVARKIEIGESFFLPVLTMLRRSNTTQGDMYRPIQITPALTGPALYSQWLEFLKQESKKRLVLHCFNHDAQTSMVMQNNNVMSTLEMGIPLPAPMAIWSAETADVWKSAMLSSTYNSSSSGPSVSQCIDDISHLVNVRDHVDFPLSALLVLDGYWHFIRQHQELATLSYQSKSSVPSSSTLYLTTRQQELVALLKRFRHCVIPLLEGPPRKHVTLVHEVLTMYLHIRMAELQVFAGKQGEQASREAFSRLKVWIASSDSRASIRHAAQVLRTAAQLRPGSLRDFIAIAVYHASLTLWSYGTIARASRDVTARPLGPRIVLDEPDDELVESFVAIGQGKPCISIYDSDGTTSTEGPAELENPPAVMRACLRVLEGNFGKLAQGLKMPLLVENLAKLMRDLGTNAFITVK